MPPQHRSRDLLRIGEVRKAAFIDGYAGDQQSGDQFGAQFRPDLIVWIPVLLSEIAGFTMIRRVN